MTSSPTIRSETALGRYRLGPLLGRGATSSVRRAVDIRTGHQVAVKTIPDTPDLVARVGREVRAASRLKHPRIVEILDWGTDPDSVRLVWELVDGPALSTIIASGHVDDHTAVTMMSGILDALDHAHARGVVHRDVKPANILIGSDGIARLGDFGIARVTGDASVTMTGDVVGTVAYMAPEQARGDDVDERADVYSASLVLYELLTGENPNRGHAPAVALHRAIHGQVPDIREWRPDLPDELADLIMAGLSPSPAFRPRAGVLADGLRAVGPINPRRLASRRVPGWAIPTIHGVIVAAAAALAIGQWTELPFGTTAATAAAIGVGFAAAPAFTTLVVLSVALILLGRDAQGLALALAVPALVLVISTRTNPRIGLAAAGVPVAFGLGLGPLAIAIIGVAARGSRRISLAFAGVSATLIWQLLEPGHGVLLHPNGVVSGLSVAMGESNPLAAVTAVVSPLEGQTWVAVHAGVLVIAALAAGLMSRRDGPAVLMIAVLWTVSVTFALAAVAPDPATTAVACVPSAIILIAWALRPWRHLPRLGRPGVSATVPEHP